MGRTRATASIQPSATEEPARGTSITYLQGPNAEVWIAQDFSSDFLLINLPDPKTSKPRQFALASSHQGVGGETNTTPTIGEIRTFEGALPASFLVEGEFTATTGQEPGREPGQIEAHKDGIFATKQTLRLVTPIDLIYLLLPALCPKPKRTTEDGDRPRTLFLPFDDLVTKWEEIDGSQAALLQNSPCMHESLKDALDRVCDAVDVGGDKAYRFSLPKFSTIVLDKATKLVDAGLPPTLEERAAKLVEKLADGSAKVESGGADSPASTNTPGELSVSTSDSQESMVSAVFSEPGNAGGSQANTTAIEDTVEKLGRLRVALGFVLANYVPAHVSEMIVTEMDKGEGGVVQFEPLRAYVEGKRKQEKRMAAAVNTANFSRKRSADDDERAEERAEKKRKQEEEDKKKKEASIGVKALAKVNTTGMKKMTSFFQSKSKK